ncbi:putative quinol monooxygenase [Yinghuangia aomiensis]|uniref:putative quinol monooxygenase n=1 Tax=Yinghuangia aomiensis TaxID=676205 RepID=UPI0031E665F1
MGLFIRVEVKPDKVSEFEAKLKTVVDIVRAEGLAAAWFGLRTGPTSFAIFDVFANDEDRQAHLAANFEALRSIGAELFVGEPVVDHIDVSAAMLRGE